MVALTSKTAPEESLGPVGGRGLRIRLRKVRYLFLWLTSGFRPSGRRGRDSRKSSVPVDHAFDVAFDAELELGDLRGRT